MNHSFDVDIACKFGVEEAIVIENLMFRLRNNKANDRNFHDGRYWTYGNARTFSELFWYWSPKKIERLLKKLEDKGVIVSARLNESAHDRTKWYSVSNDLIVL